jgi:hypothetical protein
VYKVEVAMDGTNFLATTTEVLIHPELSVQKQLPELLDLSRSTVVPELELVRYFLVYVCLLDFCCLFLVTSTQCVYIYIYIHYTTATYCIL